MTVEYDYDHRPVRVDTIVISTQHADDATQEQIAEDLERHVIRDVVPDELLDQNVKTYVNPSGRFVIGGPVGDSGLTGRKIIVDTYGGSARHGGGAFSGKDPTKVDRSGAYAARHVAKNIVAAGIAERAEVQVSYAIGIANPVSVMVDTPRDRQTLRTGYWATREQALRPPTRRHHQPVATPQAIYKQTAAYGHFGRPDLDLPVGASRRRGRPEERRVRVIPRPQIPFRADIWPN